MSLNWRCASIMTARRSRRQAGVTSEVIASVSLPSTLRPQCKTLFRRAGMIGDFAREFHQGEASAIVWRNILIVRASTMRPRQADAFKRCQVLFPSPWSRLPFEEISGGADGVR